jgi:signal recognition particle subunit SRP54
MRSMMGGMAQKMGLGGLGGLPDPSSLDPRQLEALQKQLQSSGLGGGAGGLPGLGGGLPKLPGLGGLPGLPKKK